MRKRAQLRNPSPPKVWIVAPSPPPYGGMSVQAQKLRERLSSEGFAVDLIPTNPAPPQALEMLGRIPVVRTMLREIQYLASLVRIARNPGIVHHFSASYLFFFLHSAPLLILGRCTSGKTLLNYRGGKAEEFLRRWSWAVLPLLRCADEIAVPSEFLQGVFHEFGLEATVLPNLADTDLFPFEKREHFVPRLFVSRTLEPMYDVECVLKAVRLVQEKLPETTLGVAGDGSEAGKLRRLVQEWGLRGITFYGAVPHKDLPLLYRQYDIYLNASRVDNFPGALVEAACSGLPIVTTRAGGIAEMIQHRQNGLLVDIGDGDALAASVLELLSRQDVARRLAQNARSWAEQFSWHNVFPQLLRCYGIAAECTGSVLRPDPLPAH